MGRGCCLSSRSAGVDGVNRKGGKRCADGDLKYCGNFSSKTRTTRTTSFPYDYSLVCSLVKCSLNRQGDNSIVFRLVHTSPKTCCRYSPESIHPS